MQIRNLIILISCLNIACANLTSFKDYGFKLARKNGFTSTLIQTASFDITAFSRIQNHVQPLHVYIEGDGFAWATKSHLSNDPTPHQPIALELAIEDHYPNVVYIARPCQYQQSNRICSSDYWSNRRFSAEVIESMNQAISQFNIYNQPIEIIGYSGGAAIAILIAANRNDVVSIRTVAGNLDHELVNRSHHVNEMSESLNAIDVVRKIESIPQIHYIGAADKIIPREVAVKFIEVQKPSQCASLVEVIASHQIGWKVKWQELMRIPITCNKN